MTLNAHRYTQIWMAGVWNNNDYFMYQTIIIKAECGKISRLTASLVQFSKNKIRDIIDII